MTQSGWHGNDFWVEYWNVLRMTLMALCRMNSRLLWRPTADMIALKNKNNTIIIILYYIALYCIVLHCMALYCIVLYCIALWYIISYHIISYHITSYHIISYHIISYHIILYYIILYYITVKRFLNKRVRCAPHQHLISPFQCSMTLNGINSNSNNI